MWLIERESILYLRMGFLLLYTVLSCFLTLCEYYFIFGAWPFLSVIFPKLKELACYLHKRNVSYWRLLEIEFSFPSQSLNYGFFRRCMTFSSEQNSLGLSSVPENPTLRLVPTSIIFYDEMEIVCVSIVSQSSKWSPVEFNKILIITRILNSFLNDK